MTFLITDAIIAETAAVQEATAAVMAATAAVEALPAALFAVLHPDYSALMTRLDAIEARQVAMIDLLGGGLLAALENGRLRVKSGGIL